MASDEQLTSINDKLDMVINRLDKLEKKMDEPKLGHEWRITKLEEWQAECVKRAQEQAKDLKGILIPVLTRGLEYAIGAGSFVILGHLFGLFK